MTPRDLYTSGSLSLGNGPFSPWVFTGCAAASEGTRPFLAGVFLDSRGGEGLFDSGIEGGSGFEDFRAFDFKDDVGFTGVTSNVTLALLRCTDRSDNIARSLLETSTDVGLGMEVPAGDGLVLLPTLTARSKEVKGSSDRLAGSSARVMDPRGSDVGESGVGGGGWSVDPSEFGPSFV